ncbi:Starch-binding associating with outer membrane [Pustulibacterium marinum]|uniref:Starch-binding associating with outer membrane n=1 Tax=Pustulibacterium marinum TaxID=1224947 RepID=A0A1I7GFA8_9FLAO|nr:SusD/RagB family nutrient-binding outer membrane lipoprotein [Pustulibacterium marinum]SFU46956.1 Starch-binding associating with outer membrane [Pustulibacterium marinum]
MKTVRILYMLVVAAMLWSCTNNFDEVNTDPNRIEQISPGTLLNPIIYGIASHNAGRADNITFNLMQVALPFPSESGGLHRYDVSAGIGNSSWNAYYRWLKNINEMELAADAYEDPNYKAIALTLKALVYANLTDLFGPIPMTEALKGDEDIIYPGFNSQEFVYETILADLETANELYNLGQPMAYAEDILFYNDVTKWQKFTNSLHLRLLLRIAGVQPQNFATMASMVNNPDVYPVFETTDESAILQVTGVEPNVSPWSRPQDFRLSTKVAAFFLDNLNAWEDPRRPVIATTATDIDNNAIGYQGIPSAYDPVTTIFNFEASTFNIEQVTNPMKIVLLPYAEVAFIKAELAQRGYLDNAATYYENGVIAAMEQVGATAPLDYFSNPLVQYNGTLEQILLQKYYALYFVDYQQWFEYRRTGYPQLPQTSAMFNNGVMPSRLYYPTDLPIENASGYQEALELLNGEDNINTKVWWDNN